MPHTRTKPVVTTGELVPGMFIQVDQVRADKSGGVRVTGHPTAVAGVSRVTTTVDRERARELGLVD